MGQFSRFLKPRRWALAEVCVDLLAPAEYVSGGVKVTHDSIRGRCSRRAAAAGPALLAILLASALCGCTKRPTQFAVTNYSPDSRPERFHEVFDECYYALDPSGNVDVVARRVQELEGGGESITQVVHLRTMYLAIPGSTHVERSMINTTVNYAILSDSGGACFEGAGLVVCRENNRARALTGQLESGRISPVRRVGASAEIFDRALIEGRFNAKHDRRAVVRILNELNRVFGPRPAYDPGHRPDLM